MPKVQLRYLLDAISALNSAQEILISDPKTPMAMLMKIGRASGQLEGVIHALNMELEVEGTSHV